MILCFQLYWSFQENGLPISALPNGPSSLSPEERERIEQQKLQDIASSLQNFQDFSGSSAASTIHYSCTELSLTPENNIVFRADTPPTGKETLRTGQQQVPEGAVQTGWENRPGPSLVGGSGEQSHFAAQQSTTGEKEAHFVAQPQMVITQPEIQESAQYQPDLHTQQIQNKQSETFANSENLNTPTDSNGSNANNTSQKVLERRNKKKRPPNYYEKKENSSNDTSEINSPPELEAESGGAAQLTNNVNNVPPPVNMVPQQNLSQTVPMQNVPPEMVAQIIHANQQQYVQFFTNYLAAASVDPQFAQQQHQHQQQIAIAAVNALIQQGNLPGMFPMQVPPPHLLHHVMGQMQPGQMPLQQDTRIPPPNVEASVEETQPKYPPPMPQSEHLQQNRHSVERQFQPHQHRPDNGRDFTNSDKPPSQSGLVNVSENKFNQERVLRNHGHESHARPSPPNQELPPSNNVKYEHSPNVPQLQERQVTGDQTYTHDVSSGKEDSDFEAQKQLQESIEKVTFEYQALQKNESIRKLIEPEKPKEAIRTEECDKNVTADKVFESNQSQSKQCASLPSETQDMSSVQKSQVPESATKEVSSVSEAPPGEEQKAVLTQESVQIPESRVIGTESADSVSVDGNASNISVVESQQTDTATKGTTSLPQVGNNPTAPSKPAGAWGSKPGGWAALFKNTETAAKSVVIYADGQQANSTETVKKTVETNDATKEGTPEKPVAAAEDKAAKQLGGKF